MTPLDEPMGTAADIAAAARTTRIIVVGSLNLDTALTVAHHPQPGETISASSRTLSIGGKGANQAVAAARAGATVSMIGAVGSDADATTIVEGLNRAGVDTHQVQRQPGESGAAVVVVAADGENLIVVSAGANAAIDLDAVDSALGTVRPGDVVVLQNEIPPAATSFAARRARELGAHVVWNAAPAPIDRTEIPVVIDTLVVNEGELAAIAALLALAPRSPAGRSPAGEAVDFPSPSGRNTPQPHAAERRVAAARSATTGTAPAHSDATGTAAAVARDLGVDVVCTLGAAGVTAMLGGQRYSIPSPVVTAVDTTAAGDTFVGYFSALAAMPSAERLRVAAAAGAAAVTQAGAAASIPGAADVAALLQPDHPDTTHSRLDAS